MSRFEWDSEKARVNLAKHGVSFGDADTVDGDPLRKILPDPLHDTWEDRYILMGHSRANELLVVVVSQRGRRPRILSARRATKRERHAYEARP